MLFLLPKFKIPIFWQGIHGIKGKVQVGLPSPPSKNEFMFTTRVVKREVYFLESEITDFSLPQAISVTDDHVRYYETRINSAADGAMSFLQLKCKTYQRGKVSEKDKGMFV